MTETKQTELKNDIGAKLIIYGTACERTSSFRERLQLTEELATELATATQQAVEAEKSRLQIKTAVNIMLTRLTPNECTEVMEKIYPEGIVIRPEERESLSQKGTDAT